MTITRTHHDAPGRPANAAFSEAVSVSGNARTIYVGGQNAIGPDGVMGDDLATQTAVALHNLEAVLGAAGASLSDIVSWSALVVAGQPLGAAFGAFQEVWGDRGRPPAITVAVVHGLANPAFLCEISAVAVTDGDARLSAG
jgi:enamine deaminase RidA (YjgF/YER057c/UK114 family)